MKTSALFTTLLAIGFFALRPASVEARGVVYFGEYQLVQKGQATTRIEANISISGGKKKKGASNDIRCTFKGAAGSESSRTLLFQSEQCVRKGYHILCHKEGRAINGDPLTHVCWGDIYHKPTAKGMR